MGCGSSSIHDQNNTSNEKNRNIEQEKLDPVSKQNQIRFLQVEPTNQIIFSIICKEKSNSTEMIKDENIKQPISRSNEVKISKNNVNKFSQIENTFKAQGKRTILYTLDKIEENDTGPVFKPRAPNSYTQNITIAQGQITSMYLTLMKKHDEVSLPVENSNTQTVIPKSATRIETKVTHVEEIKGPQSKIIETKQVQVNHQITPQISQVEYFSKPKTDIAINNRNYGPAFLYANTIWLEKDLTESKDQGQTVSLVYGKGPGKSGQNDYSSAQSACPSGWRLPSKEEFEALLENLGNSKEEMIANYKKIFKPYFSPQGFSAYISSTASDYEERNYYALTYDPTLGFSIVEKWKWANGYHEQSNYSVRCANDPASFLLSMTFCSADVGIPKKFEAPIIGGVKAARWIFNDDIRIDCPVAEYTFNDLGMIPVKLIYLTEQDTEFEICTTITVRMPVLLGEEIFYDGKCIGNAILIGNQIWLNKDLEYFITSDNKKCSLLYGKGPGPKGENCYRSSCEAPPHRWLLPQRKDFETLLNFIGDDPYFQVEFFKNGAFQTKFYENKNEVDYVCQDIEGNNATSFKVSSNQVSFSSVWSYANSDVKFATRIIADKAFIFSKNSHVFNKGSEISLASRKFTGVREYTWDMGDGTEKKGAEIKHIYNDYGYYTVTVTLDIGRGVYYSAKVPVWVVDILDDQIIDGINYGKAMVIGRQIWMTKDVEYKFKTEKNKICLLYGKGPGAKGENDFAVSNQPPTEWRLPERNDFKELIDSLSTADEIDKYCFLTSKEGFAGDPVTGQYITSTASGEHSYVSFNIQKGKYEFGEKWEYANSGTKFSTRYIKNPPTGFYISGLGSKDALLNSKITMAICAIGKHYYWDFGNGEEYHTRSIEHQFTNIGLNTFTCKFTDFTGTSHISTIEVYVRFPFGDLSKNITTLTKDMIRTVKFDYVISANDEVMWTCSACPCAPKGTGGAYIAFLSQSSNTYTTTVVEIDPEGNQIGDPIEVMQNAHVMDICITDDGFAVLLSTKPAQNVNETFSFAAYTNSRKRKFIRTLVDTPKDPAVKNNKQFCFYTADGNPVWGMAAMYNCDHGRISYGRGRLALNFAHYNNFGTKEKKDAHTGEGFFTFDSETGEDDKMAYAFGVSHSVTNRLLYDGEYFYSANLGDMYPMAIQFTKCEPKKSTNEKDSVLGKHNRLHYEICDTGVFILGNGSGESSGRMSEIIELEDGTMCVCYTRRKGKTNIYGGGSKSSTVSDFGVIFVSKGMFVKKVIVLNDKSDMNIVTLKAVRYGKNILVVYITSNPEKNSIWLPRRLPTEYTLNAMILDHEGKVLKDGIKINDVRISASSDIEVLNNGDIIITGINSQRNLMISIIKLKEIA